LRRANAILKDASVYFAQELDPATVTRYVEERRDAFESSRYIARWACR